MATLMWKKGRKCICHQKVVNAVKKNYEIKLSGITLDDNVEKYMNQRL